VVSLFQTMPDSVQLEAQIDPARALFFRRLWVVLAVLVAVVLMLLIPPYINVNRYQKRITASIAESLGRPVHLDHVALTLLPEPGFTLDNFVVSEDPAFGSEPTIRAATVRATLRVSTLWRRRIEFSSIALTDPSINLVHTAQGTWNLDSILLQASHIAAAPTAQRRAGPAPRFPYIEATNARVNLKLDDVKVAYALTEADFALWLPSPDAWHFRITTRPVRTDLPLGYTGILHLDGVLGRAPTLEQIPIDLHGEWREVPLGEFSKMVLGRDAGWRGSVTLTASAVGTVGSNDFHTRLHIEDARRAEFVPEDPVSVTAECQVTFASAFHAVPDGHCAVPARSSSDPPALTLSGSIPDLRRASEVSFEATLPPTPAENLVPILETLSTRVPEGLKLGGTVRGSLTYQAEPPMAGKTRMPRLTGNILFSGGTIQLKGGDAAPIVLGDVVLRPAAAAAGVAAKKPVGDEDTLTMPAAGVSLGGDKPAVVEGVFGPRGYTLHVTYERMSALVAALPQVGDGLGQLGPKAGGSGAVRVDLVASRVGGGGQTWRETNPLPRIPTHLGRHLR
jgi:hypothetical protein